ncbi:MAG: serine hydrolase domain-containing protein [Oscillochloridaceae bacterium umkhey_bin13]
MGDLHAILDDAVAANAVPFVVAMTGNSQGTTWSGAAGERAPGAPASEDTVFRIFSMTKAIGSTAAMILIDRGKLSMDTPVATIIPEFAKVQLLAGFGDDGQPILRAPHNQVTVRHLATHTSGFVYQFWNATMPKYMEVTGHPTILSGLKASLFYPLLFEPGTQWDYGIGIDWLGQVVEAVDGRQIDAFCRDEIFGPLGMTDTDFEPTERLANRLASVKIRGEDGNFADFSLAPPSQPEVYGMGHNLYSTAPDYLRFLRMFLNRGQLDGNRVLSEAGVATMLANQIGDLRVGKLMTVAPPLTADAEFYPGVPKTHSFGFVRVEQDVPGRCSAGSQIWAGVLNTHYWFDPARDLAAVIMTQSLPFVEPPFMDVYERYERAVYAGATS